jgi:hypothetical protein
MNAAKHVNVHGHYKSGSVCKGLKQSAIYAWAMDAPTLVLPPDVAFKVGPHTNAKYLVLQVHYAQVEMFESESILSLEFALFQLVKLINSKNFC